MPRRPRMSHPIANPKAVAIKIHNTIWEPTYSNYPS